MAEVYIFITKKGWRPRRLGGGLGNSRRAPSPVRAEVEEVRRRGGYGYAGDEKRDQARERAKLLDRSKRDKAKEDKYVMFNSLLIFNFDYLSFFTISSQND